MSRRSNKGDGALGLGCVAVVFLFGPIWFVAAQLHIDLGVATLVGLAFWIVVGLWLFLKVDARNMRLRGEAYALLAARRAPFARSPIRPGLRFAVLNRDQFTCQYCGRRNGEPGVRLHVDHRVPVAKGGDNSMSNLVTACEECNLGKSNSSIRETP